MTASPFEKLEQAVGHHFKDQSLLRDALTHSSTGGDTNYERLEFLGDRVLGLVIAEILYSKFPDETEGDLAKRLAALVQGSLLAQIAAGINLGGYILLSEAEAAAGGAQKENILADSFEALIGALYLDGGPSPCRVLVDKLWSESFFEMKKPPLHPKTRLQEWAQGAGLPLPFYEIVGQHGPDHAPVFDIKLSVKGFDEVIAQGRSRQEAEKEAALLFIKKMESGR